MRTKKKILLEKSNIMTKCLTLHFHYMRIIRTFFLILIKIREAKSCRRGQRESIGAVFSGAARRPGCLMQLYRLLSNVLVWNSWERQMYLDAINRSKIRLHLY